MAAAAKVTPEGRREIMRRRDARERLESIAGDFGICHHQVSRIAREERQRRAEAQAKAAAEREWQARLAATASAHRVSLRRDAVGPIFFSAEHRLEYYSRRSLESECDKLNYNNVRRGELTPAEHRALKAGRTLFLS
jgi:hypothetical protein